MLSEELSAERPSDEPARSSGPEGSPSGGTPHVGIGLTPVRGEHRGPELIENGMVHVDPDPEIVSPPRAAGWAKHRPASPNRRSPFVAPVEGRPAADAPEPSQCRTIPGSTDPSPTDGWSSWPRKPGVERTPESHLMARDRRRTNGSDADAVDRDQGIAIAPIEHQRCRARERRHSQGPRPLGRSPPRGPRPQARCPLRIEAAGTGLRNDRAPAATKGPTEAGVLAVGTEDPVLPRTPRRSGSPRSPTEVDASLADPLAPISASPQSGDDQAATVDARTNDGSSGSGSLRYASGQPEAAPEGTRLVDAVRSSDAPTPRLVQAVSRSPERNRRYDACRLMEPSERAERREPTDEGSPDDELPPQPDPTWPRLFSRTSEGQDPGGTAESNDPDPVIEPADEGTASESLQESSERVPSPASVRAAGGEPAMGRTAPAAGEEEAVSGPEHPEQSF